MTQEQSDAIKTVLSMFAGHNVRFRINNLDAHEASGEFTVTFAQDIPVPVVAPVAGDNGDDEYTRLNYYKKADFARYQAARAAGVPDDTGITPWVNPEDFKTPEPSVAEWATFSPEKKLLGHVDV